MPETIGLLGGSFNPIHLGHLAMAQAARDELRLDRLLILPDGDPPHKSTELAHKNHRLEMARLAAAGRFEVSPMEIDRPGKTYTIDTLEALRAGHPQARLVMIIGADTLHELPTWRDAGRVYTMCEFAVFARDDLPLEADEGVRWMRMQARIPDISATEIRERVHQGLSLERLVPEAVEAYIGMHRLYAPPEPVRGKALQGELKRTLPAARLRHVLGVEKTIRKLAQRWGYSEEKAALTGLLHDCAKGMDLAQMQAYVAWTGIAVDDLRMQSVALLHAPASAAMARQRYGVTDPDILRAIRYHNTGGEEMGILDKLLFVADMAEPCRKPTEALERLQTLSMRDLDAAVCAVFENKLGYILGTGKELHPDTLAAYEAMKCPK